MAYTWYKKTLESDKDQKRYMFMMLQKNKDDDEWPWRRWGVKTALKRYALSSEKTFSSLFFPQKESFLYLLDHFSAKTGKFAIQGFPHKLGLFASWAAGHGQDLPHQGDCALYGSAHRLDTIIPHPHEPGVDGCYVRSIVHDCQHAEDLK